MADILFLTGGEQVEKQPYYLSLLEMVYDFIQNLGGHKLISVGSPQTGVTREAIHDALQAHPEASIICGWMHGVRTRIVGNPRQSETRLGLTLEPVVQDMALADLCSLISHCRYNQPVDYFSFSCHSGERKSVALLPTGSTYVIFSDTNTGTLFVPDVTSFHVPEKTGRVLGEDFFLSFLNRGYGDMRHVEGSLFHPRIAISQGDGQQPIVYNFWDMACENSTMIDSKGQFSPASLQILYEKLKPHFDVETLDKAMKAFSDFHRNQGDKKEFEAELRQTNLFSVVCAISYCLSDAPDKAFLASKLAAALPPRPTSSATPQNPRRAP